MKKTVPLFLAILLGVLFAKEGSAAPSVSSFLFIQIHRPALSPEELSQLKALSPAGVFLARTAIQNPLQLRALVKNIRSLYPKTNQPIISIAPTSESLGRIYQLLDAPPPRAIAAGGSEMVKKFSGAIHLYLKSLGISASPMPHLYPLVPNPSRDEQSSALYFSDKEQEVSQATIDYAVGAIQAKVMPIGLASELPGRALATENDSVAQVKSAVKPAMKSPQQASAQQMLSMMESTALYFSDSKAAGQKGMGQGPALGGLSILKMSHSQSSLKSVVESNGIFDAIFFDGSITDASKFVSHINSILFAKGLPSSQMQASLYASRIEKIQSIKEFLGGDFPSPQNSDLNGHEFRSKKIQSLDQTLLEMNFNKQWSLLEKKKLQLGKQNWIVMAVNPNFFKKFSAAWNQKDLRSLAFQSIPKNAGSDIAQIPEVKTDQKVIFPMTKRTQLEWIKKWPAQIRKKTLLLVMAETGLTILPEEFLGVINLYYAHEGAAKVLAAALN